MTTRTLRRTPALALVACIALTGCSRQQSAISDAKKDVAATGRSEEVMYTDGSGNISTTMISPAPQGASAETVTTTTASGGSIPAGLPDWSNGHPPARRQAARYTAPGLPVADAAPPVEPGAAPLTSAPAAAVPGGGEGSAPAAGYGPATAPPAFVPTDVTLPRGTGLAIRINQRIEVKHAVPGERFTGELASDVSRDGRVVLPRGTAVRGVVDAAHRRGHFKGRSILELRLTTLVMNGRNYPLETADFVASKKGKGKRTAGFIGGTAGVGMLVGGIASGGVGLAVGGLAGGGLGTLLAGATGNRDIVIPAESLVRFRLQDDLTVQPAE